ncbi:MAG: GNAT family N-acetyltransferase [Burkholderiales bacterium]|nr:GNAT family N-acetyltransferase [Burkholderiales bacterium]
MDIRPVRDGEEATLFEIHRAVFYSHIEQIWGWDEDWQKANFARELESSTTSVVSINGLIVGYVQLCDEGRNIYLRNIALIAKYQRKGIGTRLIQQIQTQAAAKGVPLELGVFRTNAPARKLYERLGFEKTCDTETHVQMSWKAI